MEATSRQATPAWRPGDRLLLDEGRREVVVEDIVAGQVCCRWIDNGIPRSSWIPADRLRSLRAQADRVIVLS